MTVSHHFRCEKCSHRYTVKTTNPAAVDLKLSCCGKNAKRIGHRIES